MEVRCEVCKKEINEEPIIHIAGFPERSHILCSNQCLTLFLRMEDDEQE